MSAPHTCDDLTPEQDVAAAKAALAAKDLGHAATHIAAALGVDPLAPAYRALFETWYAAADDPLALVPLANGSSYSLVAMHAAVLTRKGRTADAISYLLRVAAVRPDVPFLAWAAEWVPTAKAAAAVSPDQLEQGLSEWARSLGRRPPEPHAMTIDAGLTLARHLCEAHPDAVAPGYWYVAALRSLDRIPEALEEARALYARKPEWKTALAVGMVLRRTDDFDGAVAMFRKALEHDPSDVGCRIDLGDMLTDHGRIDEGLAYYDEALEAEPDDEWALASSLYFHAVRDNDEGAAEKLRLLTFNDPSNRRAAVLAEKLANKR